MHTNIFQWTIALDSDEGVVCYTRVACPCLEMETQSKYIYIHALRASNRSERKYLVRDGHTTSMQLIAPQQR